MIVELIPKQVQKPIFGQTFFLFVAIAVLAGAVIAIFILQQFIRNTQAELDVLEKTLAEDTRPLEEALEKELQGYKKKTDLLASVLGERKTLFPFLSRLERTTHPDVFFHDLKGDAGTGIFTLGGEARSFFVLEQQRLVWNEESVLGSKLQDISLGEAGTGNFTVEFTVDPRLLDPL